MALASPAWAIALAGPSQGTSGATSTASSSAERLLSLSGAPQVSCLRRKSASERGASPPEIAPPWSIALSRQGDNTWLSIPDSRMNWSPRVQGIGKHNPPHEITGGGLHLGWEQRTTEISGLTPGQRPRAASAAGFIPRGRRIDIGRNVARPRFFLLQVRDGALCCGFVCDDDVLRGAAYLAAESAGIVADSQGEQLSLPLPGFR